MIIPGAARRAGPIAIALGILALAGATLAARAEGPGESTVVALREVAQRLTDPHAAQPLHRPLTLASSAASGEMVAVSHGVIDRPFQDLIRALADREHWCAVLVLHINNKGCHTTVNGGVPHIALKVARKYDQPVEQAYDIDFTYHAIEASPALLSVRLEAPSGPLGTSDFVISLDATPFGPGRTAVRLSYAYRHGTMASMAMSLYFATVGRGKVGFTVTGRAANGELQYIDGARGLAERNLMRYFLAVEAAASEPDGSASDLYLRRLRHWFKATEEYPRQLHEVDEATYLDLKLKIKPQPGA